MNINRIFILKNETGGFTLIELLVVIVIIGILAAIAIPMYLHQRQQAWDASAKSDLYNAAVAEVTYLAQFAVYTNDIDALNAAGYNKTDAITFTPVIEDGGTNYCLEAFHSGAPDRIWFIRSGIAQPDPELGEC